MLPKDHLTSHSRISVSRWVTTPSWLSRSLRPSLHSSVNSCHHNLFYHFCPLLCLSLHEMFLWYLQFSWDLWSFSYSIVFLYFFAFPLSLHLRRLYLGLLFSETLHSVGYIFPFLCFLLLFSAICKASLHNHFAFLHFFFLGMVLVTTSCTMLWTSIHSSSGTLSTRSNPLNLFITYTV